MIKGSGVNNKVDLPKKTCGGEIDRLVYDLYRLTEEEIKIAEGGN